MLTYNKLPKGIEMLSIREANNRYGSFLQSRLTKLQEIELFLKSEGCFLYIPSNLSLPEPISLLVSPGDERIHLYVGEGSKVKICLNYELEQGQSIQTGVDVALEAGATLAWEDIAMVPFFSHFSSFHASIKRGATLNVLSVSSGGTVSNYQIELLQQEAEATVKGLSVLKEERRDQIQVLMRHLAVDTRSRQHFKSVLLDESNYEFEGKIWVDKVAQKTGAYQLMNALLLSERATAVSKPNLEIFADDVKASHGATISQLSKEDLLYLQTRGLAEKEAKQLLVKGFCEGFYDISL